mgnify:FL=1
MEALFTLLQAFGPLFDNEYQSNFSRLPVEMICSIFRMLDGRSLFTVSTICRRWSQIIRKDHVLKKKLKEHVRVAKMDSLNIKRSEGVSKKRKHEEDQPVTKRMITPQTKSFQSNGTPKKPKIENKVVNIVRRKLIRF